METTQGSYKKVTARKPTVNNPLPTQTLAKYGQSDTSGDDDNDDDDVDYARLDRSQRTRDTADDVTPRQEKEVLYKH